MTADARQTPAPTDAGGPIPAPRWRRRLLLAALFLFLMAGLAVLGVSKLWRVSPPGMQPPLRVSALDLLQARSLAATARKHAAAGRHVEALQAWLSCLANNEADLDHWREALDWFAATPPIDAPEAFRLLTNLDRFLQFAGDDPADLDRALKVCQQYHRDSQLLMLLEEHAPESDRWLKLRLETLLRVGRAHEFAALLERFPDRLPTDPLFRLHPEAYQAGWGPAAEADTHWRALQTALDDPDLAETAARLILIASAQRPNLPAAAAAIQKLDQLQRTTPADHARFWLTLVRNGDTAAARALAEQFAGAPSRAFELSLLAAACESVGLPDKARQLLLRWCPLLGYQRHHESAEVWMALGSLLRSQKDWRTMAETGATLERMASRFPWLTGYAAYLQGHAAHESAQGPLAEDRLHKAAAADYPLGALGIDVALGLWQLGRAREADQLLRRLPTRLHLLPRYWENRWNVTLTLRENEDALLEAASRLLELQPESTAVQFNYAAALLARRERLAEALRYTFQVWQGAPTAPGRILNHALALAMNGRTDEADALLEPLQPDRLTPEERISYVLARLEIAVARKDADGVRAWLPRVDRSLLFPTERRWLDQVAARWGVAPAASP